MCRWIPAYPKDRLAFMLEDTKTPILLTVAALVDRLPPSKARVVILDDWAEFGRESGKDPVCATTADNLAYIDYTSGSTGTPKGVAIRHRGVVRLLFGAGYARLDAAQTLLHLSPISFDASTLEVWGSLLHGGRCALYPERVPTAEGLRRAIEEYGVTTLWLTSSLFNAVIDDAPETLAGVRQLLIGGEALSVRHVRRALALLSSTAITNGYGPTEGTTFTCCYAIPGELGDAASIPIGRPIGNTAVYVLNAHLDPVPVGVPGELYIGGDWLSAGLSKPARSDR